MSIPAGVLEMRFWRYVVLTLAGSAVWCFAFAAAGWAAGANWTKIHDASSVLDYLVVAAVIGVAGWLVYRWTRRRRLPKDSVPSAESDG